MSANIVVPLIDNIIDISDTDDTIIVDSELEDGEIKSDESGKQQTDSSSSTDRKRKTRKIESSPLSSSRRIKKQDEDWSKIRILVIGDERVPSFDWSAWEDLPIQKIFKDPSGDLSSLCRLADKNLDSGFDVVLIIGLHKELTSIEYCSASRCNVLSTKASNSTDMHYRTVREIITVYNEKWRRIYPNTRVIWTLPYPIDFYGYNSKAVRSTSRLTELPIIVEDDKTRDYYQLLKQMGKVLKRELPRQIQLFDMCNVLFFGKESYLDSFTMDSAPKFPLELLNCGFYPTEKMAVFFGLHLVDFMVKQEFFPGFTKGITTDGLNKHYIEEMSCSSLKESRKKAERSTPQFEVNDQSDDVSDSASGEHSSYYDSSTCDDKSRRYVLTERKSARYILEEKEKSQTHRDRTELRTIDKNRLESRSPIEHQSKILDLFEIDVGYSPPRKHRRSSRESSHRRRNTSGSSPHRKRRRTSRSSHTHRKNSESSTERKYRKLQASSEKRHRKSSGSSTDRKHPKSIVSTEKNRHRRASGTSSDRKHGRLSVSPHRRKNRRSPVHSRSRENLASPASSPDRKHHISPVSSLKTRRCISSSSRTYVREDGSSCSKNTNGDDDKFIEIVNRLKKSFEMECETYRKNPRSHPKYDDEREKFEEGSGELTTVDSDKKFLRFWNKRMESIFEEKWIQIQVNLSIQYGTQKCFETSDSSLLNKLSESTMSPKDMSKEAPKDTMTQLKNEENNTDVSSTQLPDSTVEIVTNCTEKTSESSIKLTDVLAVETNSVSSTVESSTDSPNVSCAELNSKPPVTSKQPLGSCNNKATLLASSWSTCQRNTLIDNYEISLPNTSANPISVDESKITFTEKSSQDPSSSSSSLNPCTFHAANINLAEPHTSDPTIHEKESLESNCSEADEDCIFEDLLNDPGFLEGLEDIDNDLKCSMNDENVVDKSEAISATQNGLLSETTQSEMNTEYIYLLKMLTKVAGLLGPLGQAVLSLHNQVVSQNARIESNVCLIDDEGTQMLKIAHGRIETLLKSDMSEIQLCIFQDLSERISGFFKKLDVFVSKFPKISIKEIVKATWDKDISSTIDFIKNALTSLGYSDFVSSDVMQIYVSVKKYHLTTIPLAGKKI